MELKLNALDTLFFRDGKPFARGDETWADSNFPPNPSVLYGAMRTALATVEEKQIPFVKIQAELGKDKFSILGIYYKIDGSNYLPLPLDFVEYKPEDDRKFDKKKPHEVNLLQISPRKSIVSKRKDFLKYLLHPKGLRQAENLEGGLITSTELNAYLSGYKSSASALILSDFLKSESKIGIGRDDSTRVAEEGLLYRVDLKRLDGVEMRVISEAKGFSQTDLDKSIVNLGGEMKLVQIKAVGRDVLDINEPKLEKGAFKIYFSTPAIFTKKGWQPDLERFGIKASLVAACIGKPLSIGGFDIRENEPKPMLKAVPSGSVYYYETEEDTAKIIANLHGKSLSDVMPEQGYGVAFVAKFNSPTI